MFHGGLNYRLYCYQVNYDALFLPVPGLASYILYWERVRGQVEAHILAM